MLILKMGCLKNACLIDSLKIKFIKIARYILLNAGNDFNPEKIYNYLNEVIGVSKENLDKVINNLKA